MLSILHNAIYLIAALAVIKAIDHRVALFISKPFK